MCCSVRHRYPPGSIYVVDSAGEVTTAISLPRCGAPPSFLPSFPTPRRPPHRAIPHVRRLHALDECDTACHYCSVYCSARNSWKGMGAREREREAKRRAYIRQWSRHFFFTLFSPLVGILIFPKFPHLPVALSHYHTFPFLLYNAPSSLTPSPRPPDSLPAPLNRGGVCEELLGVVWIDSFVMSALRCGVRWCRMHVSVKCRYLCPEIAKCPGKTNARRARLNSGTEAAAEQQVEVCVEDDGGRPVLYLAKADGELQVTPAVAPGRRQCGVIVKYSLRLHTYHHLIGKVPRKFAH
ncbi:hypothetical protein E2C01_023760 [Portunus trituberculatus]|uniref:Uncharacterized protein n=1 Tax=Portunus trituberculatus TaxID=210409 RepID=A0A5B7EC01_PORTR|nr:hypothetical protein [Portunus trituberculatus]